MGTLLPSETSVCAHKPARCQKPEDYYLKFTLIFTIRRYCCSPVTILQFRETGAPSVGQHRKLVSNTRICCCLVASRWHLHHNFVNNQRSYHAVRKYTTIVFSSACCPLTGKSGTKNKYIFAGSYVEQRDETFLNCRFVRPFKRTVSYQHVLRWHVYNDAVSFAVVTSS